MMKIIKFLLVVAFLGSIVGCANNGKSMGETLLTPITAPVKSFDNAIKGS